eukprot:696560-Prymnesium_polylepis.1
MSLRRSFARIASWACPCTILTTALPPRSRCHRAAVATALRPSRRRSGLRAGACRETRPSLCTRQSRQNRIVVGIRGGERLALEASQIGLAHAMNGRACCEFIRKFGNSGIH